MLKKLVAVIFVLFSVMSVFGCSNSDDVIRIHIRANSNSAYDQEVKLQVRDEVIGVITPLIAECKNSSDVKNILKENIALIESAANRVLMREGFDYVSSGRITNEYFPSRDYGGTTFPAGNYDALILNLGSGKGDNWWCVAYPPLCFVGSENGGSGVQYKSKILELIRKYFG